MFAIKQIDIAETFTDLEKSAKTEVVAKGRLGAVLVLISTDEKSTQKNIPIVRTTTKYTCAAQKFQSIHTKIAECAGITANNALFEIYDANYKTMGFHSDQALDLADDSYIALFSCYQNPDTPDRQLVIREKSENKEQIIPLTNNSVVIWNLDTNAKYLHKIVLSGNATNMNKWLGITFRMSKLYLDPLNKSVLHLANKEEEQEFYKLRSMENRAVNFRYPPINYTINSADLLPIE